MKKVNIGGMLAVIFMSAFLLGACGKTENIIAREVMSDLSLSRATVFREYAKIKQVTGANYNKKDGTWTI